MRVLTTTHAALYLLILLGLVGLAFPSPAGASDAPLEAGVAVVDITPPAGYRMSGYFHERLNQGVHDPLLAKSLVLRQGDTQIALVICDVIGIAPAVDRLARQKAAKAVGIPTEHIVVAATHTHTGPLYFGALRQYFHDLAVADSGSDSPESVDYPALLVDKMVAAISESHKRLTPVRLKSGIAEQRELSFNRRFHMKNGSVRTNPGRRNPDIIRAAGPIDPDVGILMFSAISDQRPLASLSVFALHLDTVGGIQYSGDYPYYLQEALKARLGEGFVSLFGIGACGDINHIDVSGKTVLKTEYIGRTLAETILDELPNLKPVEQPSLAMASQTVHVPLRQYTPEQVAWARASMKDATTAGKPFARRAEAYNVLAVEMLPGDTLPIAVRVIRLGPEVAVVGLPGEVFVDLGLAIKAASPFAHTLVLELAGDAPGYIPTRKAFAEGSYETENCRIQPGGGERMVEVAIELLQQLNSK